MRINNLNIIKMVKKIAAINIILNTKFIKLKKLKLLFIIFLCSYFSYGQSTYNVTFSVNTAGTTVGPNGIYAGAGILGGANAVPLSDPNGTGIWTGSVTLPSGLTGPFIFLNSPANASDWGAKENLIGQSCADPNNFNDRTLPIILADTTLIYCFGSCDSVCSVYGCTDSTALNFDSTATVDDSSCYYLTTYDVTLSVNTTGITVGPNGMYAGAGVLGNAMAVPLSDSNGTGIWTGVVTVPSGTTGPFIFLNSPIDGNDWGNKENLAGQSCADPANFYDRTLPIILADTTLIYCFGNCVCPVFGCTDSTAINYDSTAAFDDNSCHYPCILAPYSENFDAGIGTFTTDSGTALYNGWLRGTSTPSIGTGPQSGDVTGGSFMYIETSTSSGPGPFKLTSNCLDITTLTTPALKFNYHMYGLTIGTLDVSVNGTSLWTLSGEQGNSWNQAIVDLSPYATSDSIVILFTGTKGASFTGDIAIDAIEVDEMIVFSGGCTDSLSCNYDSTAIIDDGSCKLYGCTNIYNIISNSNNHTLLNSLILTGGLDSLLNTSGPFTIFAPTDNAINALHPGMYTALLNDSAFLTELLIYHIVSDSITSPMLSNGQIMTTLQGSDVSVTFSGGNVYINNALISIVDIVGSNGVVHVIDAVLMPPNRSVYNIISNSNNHTLFSNLINASGLDSLLNNNGPFSPFTIFAPTDNAINALPQGIYNALLNDIPFLTNMIKHHMLGGGVLMSSLMSNGQVVTPFYGNDHTIYVDSTTGPAFFINSSTIYPIDIVGSNGVVHVIDAVLFPLNLGCADPTAINYNPLATTNDGSCIYPTGLINIIFC